MRFLPVFCVLCAALCAALPAAAASESLESRLADAAVIEVVQTGPDGAPFRGVMQQYRNGDSLLSVGDGADGTDALAVVLCKKQAYFNIEARSDAGMAGLTPEQKQMRAYGLYMGVIGGVAMVQGVVDPDQALPAPGQTVTQQRETHWAYGKEHYAVTLQQAATGELRIKVTKTANVTTTPDAAPDATFSSDDDKAARLAELSPVGSWGEVVISGARGAALDDAMSIRGWMPARGDAADTVGQARSSGQACTR